ncbi:cytochrome p450 [Moniliophthora roreri]|nr:cytochrome p450 [Moniliophthora roreri]
MKDRNYLWYLGVQRIQPMHSTSPLTQWVLPVLLDSVALTATDKISPMIQLTWHVFHHLTDEIPFKSRNHCQGLVLSPLDIKHDSFIYVMLQPILLALCALSGIALLTSINRYRARMAKLNAIPTIGHAGFFLSYMSAYEFLRNANDIIQEGYNRYPNSVFKVPLLDRWLVVISGTSMIEDIRRATDEQLSLVEAAKDMLHTDTFLGKSTLDDPDLGGFIQTALTRKISLKASEVHDEIVGAFEDEIPETPDWIKVPTLSKVLNIVCRASNRLFVGLPLCRDEEWKTLNIEYTRMISSSFQVTNLFPRFIQPIVKWYLNPRPVAYACAFKHLQPIILDRLEKMKAHGKEWEGPDDLLTWIMKDADGNREMLDPEELIGKILFMNTVAIHTTSSAFTHALLNLALRLELIQPLRDEAERAIQDEGWTKAAMGKMRMMDSFLMESQRMSGSPPVHIHRMPVHDFTFSNRTVLPAGTVVMTCVRAIHLDDDNYPNASKFDALRSYKKRRMEGESLKHQMVTPQPDYLSFGIGKHACPGRFFAVSLLKFLLSHVLLHYDIKLDEGEKPKANVFGARLNADAKTQVMFKRRSV